MVIDEVLTGELDKGRLEVDGEDKEESCLA